MATELEQLARLVGNPNLEPIDSAELIEDSLRASLGGISPDKIREMEEEIRNSGNAVQTPQLKNVISSRLKAKTSETSESSTVNNSSMEKVLLFLYETREGLVEAFETCNINSKTSSLLTGQINRVASCIRYMGGEIEEFEPINHVSGLVAPNFYKNAQKVIETTIQCYSLGEIEDAKVQDNGKKILISFAGTSGKVSYRVDGYITSEEWTGNEAIDYIYTPNSGKMSVKAFENGRWVDRSDSGKYKIVWQLEESDVSNLKEKQKKNANSIDNTDEKIIEPDLNPENSENDKDIEVPEDPEEDIGNAIR